MLLLLLLLLLLRIFEILLVRFGLWLFAMCYLFVVVLHGCAHGATHVTCSNYTVQLYEDGAWYEGHWLVGARHGAGYACGADGSTHRGDFGHGAAAGYGVAMAPARLVAHVGMFARGRPHGAGRTVHVDGSLFTSVWRHGGLERNGVLRCVA